MAGARSLPIRRWGLLFLLFFMSGTSGLIYESIWSRYIKQFVGSAATAQVLVLSLFMGGMSLGAFLAARWLRRITAPVVVYGIIEGAIGLYALAFPYLFELVGRLAYDHLFPAIGGGPGIDIAKWSLAAAMILPPCVLLGTTFPLMSVGILRRDREHAGEILAVLYFTNSFGAACGALLSGFVLVGTLGLPGALMFAAALNLTIMVIAARDRTSAPPLASTASTSGSRAGGVGLAWLYLAVAFGTGLSSFMYEIGWIRLLSMILGSATHSFEVMLSAFVLGLALGGLWVRKRMDRFQRPELVLAVVQLVMGVSAVATLPAYILAIWAMGGLMGSDAERTLFDWYQFNVVRYLLCLLIMLPATFCAGMTLPLLTHVLLKRGQPEAAVGHVYGLNTLGAIAGGTLAGLVLMPVVGLKGVIVIGAFFDLVLGLALLRGEVVSGRGNRRTPRLLLNASIGTVFVLVAGGLFNLDPMRLTATVFRHGRTMLPDAYEIISYVDGRTASVAVVDNTDHEGYRIIYTNGKPDASVILDRWPAGRDPMDGPDIAGDEPNQFLVGLIPLMANPTAKTGALIGFGSGVTCHTILGSPGLERLDTIEIEPEMVRGAKVFMPVNYRAYTDDRNHIWFDDAKAYFASAGAKYDFIVSEPTNPWVSGVSSLFTVEFYREVKRYLEPGGVLAQWLQGYELSDPLLISVLAAIDQEFADYMVVRIGSSDWVILSSADGPIGALDAGPLTWPGTAEAFALLGIHDVGQVDGLITANRRLLHPYLVDQLANRDARPILDTGAERERFLRSRAEFLHQVRQSPGPVIEVLGGIARRDYPMQGIGDRRDPHILVELEQAMALMRHHESSVERFASVITVTPMTRWQAANDALAKRDADWEAWFAATYEVYRQVSPHLDMTITAWWADVRRVAESKDAPARVRLGVELLDALSAKDGPRLQTAVVASLAEGDALVPRPVVTIAGAIALELNAAPTAERRAFGERYMNDPETSDVLGYQVIRAFTIEDRPSEELVGR